MRLTTIQEARVDDSAARVWMEFITILLILFMLVAAATAAVTACLAIYNRKRRQQIQPSVAKHSAGVETLPQSVEALRAGW